MLNPKGIRNQRTLKIVKTVDSSGRESIQLSNTIMDFSVEELSLIITQLHIFNVNAVYQRNALMQEYNSKVLNNNNIE